LNHLIVYLIASPFENTPMFLKKYNGSGELIWETEKQFYNPNLNTLFLDAENNIYVSGNAFEHISDTVSKFTTIKFSASGEELWTKYATSELPGRNLFLINDGTVDANGNIYLTGAIGTGGFFGGETDLAILKYAGDGTLIWLRSVVIDDYSTVGNALLMGQDGHIYINGYKMHNETNEMEMIVLRIDQEGNQDWVSAFGENGRNVASYELKQLHNGTLVVSGFSVLVGVNNKVVLVRFDPDGNLLGSVSTGYNHYYNDMHLDDADQVYVLSQFTGTTYPYRLYYSAGAMPMGSVLKTDPSGNTEEEIFTGPELSDFFPSALVPLSDGRLLAGGTVANEFSIFQGLYFFKTNHVVLDIGEKYSGQDQWVGQNIPNPVDGITTIPVYLTNKAGVLVKIYDGCGRLVKIAFDGFLPAGANKIEMDLSVIGRGVYFYEVAADTKVQIRKLILK